MLKETVSNIGLIMRTLHWSVCRGNFLQRIAIVVATVIIGYWLYGRMSKRISISSQQEDGPQVHRSSLIMDDRQFFLSGKSLTILSGAMHYFRVPEQYWYDRMMKMKACGLNTLETYVAWNMHEPIRGQFHFEGMLNLRKYIKLAHELGLYVILRPGPYICSEWDLGGLPSWLLQDKDMKVRSNYQPYMDAVSAYLPQLLKQVVDLQYARGGPIIMVQVENEFGGYSHELEHLAFVKQELEKGGITELFVVSEPLDGIQHTWNKTLVTMNFQKTSEGDEIINIFRSITVLRLPLMVMEFWTGWFDHWDQEHNEISIEDFEERVRFILNRKASINFYMFHGGTNFGFMAGGNEWERIDTYKSDVTSYDYDAPLSETGDITPKYTKVREILTELFYKPQGITLPPVPSDIPKASYGFVEMKSYLSWEELLQFVTPLSSKDVITMENLDINEGSGQSYGYIVYRKKNVNGKELKLSGHVRDRAQILIDSQQVTVFDYMKKDQFVNLKTKHSGSLLDIVVENMGRANYAKYKSPVLNTQHKGLNNPVLLDMKILQDWTIYPLEFTKNFIQKVSTYSKWSSKYEPQDGRPSLYRAILTIKDEPKDTFINMKGWQKGVVFVNKFNLGRYWHVGPQTTLYVPAPILNIGDNEILIFEQHGPQETVTFQDNHVLG